eukprot:1150286-Pelagomonas_calceolata.AAC.4
MAYEQSGEDGKDRGHAQLDCLRELCCTCARPMMVTLTVLNDVFCCHLLLSLSRQGTVQLAWPFLTNWAQTTHALHLVLNFTCTS